MGKMNEKGVTPESGKQEIIITRDFDAPRSLVFKTWTEEDVLFTMADKVLSRQEDETLLQGFEKLEVERIGAGKHEEFHELLHKLQDIYLKQL